MKKQVSKKVPKVIVVVGPTATGKSDFAVKIARHVGGEIVSADSRQVYIGLDHGSGKITKREMHGVPHHLLDIVDPRDVYSVESFKTDGARAISDMVSRGKVPIICGGTGFYIDALLNNTSFPAVPPDTKIRKSLAKKTPENLFKILVKIDPRRAKNIDKNNKIRIIRAIEIAKKLGEVPRQRRMKKYDILTLGINRTRDDLKSRIERRLDARFPNIIREVKKLRKNGLSWKRLYDLGLEYRYISLYVRGKITRDHARALLLREIWQYARRQMTWWRRDNTIKWFSPDDMKKAISVASKFVR